MAQVFVWSMIALLALLICIPWAGIILVPMALILGSPFAMLIWYQQARDSQAIATRKTRVLVVDDDAISVAPVLQLLAKRDADVSYVDSGLAALSLLKKKSFDFLVLDHSLPDMDGEKILSQVVEAIPAGRYDVRCVPVYFHTSSPEKVHFTSAIMEGGFQLKEVFRKGVSLSLMRESFDHEIKSIVY
jgi:CheY-like chemotaxis protein